MKNAAADDIKCDIEAKNGVADDRKGDIEVKNGVADNVNINKCFN